MPNPSLRIIVLTLQQTSTIVVHVCTASPDASGTARLPVPSLQRKRSHCYAGAFSPSLPAEVVGRTPLQLSAYSHALHRHNTREHQASQGSCVQLANHHLMAGVLHVTGKYYQERHPPSSEGEKRCCIFHSLGQLLQW